MVPTLAKWGERGGNGAVAYPIFYPKSSKTPLTLLPHLVPVKSAWDFIGLHGNNYHGHQNQNRLA